LDRIDWPLLRARDFRRDPDDPGKLERYMAEALIRGTVPVSALSEIACYGPDQQRVVQEEADRLSLRTKITVQPAWYF
jgi:hypothetical protein